LLVALIALLALPLVVAIVALRRPAWYPVLDHAMLELRLHDVLTAHTPLIGLPGRIGRFPEQGSHPGPLSFYAIWPTWKVLGSTPWGMQAGALVLNIAAVAGSVLVAFRRGGRKLAIVVTVLLALLMGGYGVATLSEPWNPYIPLLWWVLTLLCVWSVLEGDVPMLVVAVFSASMAAQTHVPYLGLCLGMGAVAVAGVASTWRQAGREGRHRILVWGGVAVALAALLWSPLAVDQVTQDPGNLTMLWRHFTSPPPEDGAPVGIRQGVELQLRHLDVTSFFSAQTDSLGSLARSSGDAGGSVVPGILTLLAWSGAVVLALRNKLMSINRLNVVVAAGLALGVFSMSRIFGKVWYYLMLWSWGTVCLLVLSVGLTAWHLVGERRHRYERVALGVGVAIACVSSALLTVQAAKVDPPAPQLSKVLAAVVPPTTKVLRKHQAYLVTWDDSFYIGSQGMGLVSALDRLGFDVGVTDTWRVPLTKHRVIDPSQAHEEIHLAVGRFVDLWRNVPAAREVAANDPRTASQRAEYGRLHDHVRARLRDEGFDTNEIELVDTNLFGLSIDTRLPVDIRKEIERMLEIGSPAAVFLMPVGTSLAVP
jgi:hypothetical protein